MGDEVICTATVEDPPSFSSGQSAGHRRSVSSFLSQRIARERNKVAGARTKPAARLGTFRSVAGYGRTGERDGARRRQWCRPTEYAYGLDHGYIALLMRCGLFISRAIENVPVTDYLAAVSVGIVNGKPMLDLSYVEDSAAEVDMNLVMTGKGKIVEVQGTAEGEPFSKQELNRLLALGEKGIKALIKRQKELLK
jgi:ribonuclease PH